MAAVQDQAVCIGRAVLVCGSCPHVSEPAGVDADEFAALVRSGCPDCGGWVCLGELLGPEEGEQSTLHARERHATAASIDVTA